MPNWRQPIPREGGDYVYLTRAYGRPCGFLFAWAQLWIVRPGSIGAMAFVFAKYAQEIRPCGHGNLALLGEYAALAIVVLTLINMLGVREGKWTQNLLTVVKVLGLVSIFVAALLLPPPRRTAACGAPRHRGRAASSIFFPLSGNFALAMIFIFYAYGGWHEMAYVGAEVRNPEPQHPPRGGAGHGFRDRDLRAGQPGLPQDAGLRRDPAVAGPCRRRDAADRRGLRPRG